jgi:hypothetical protein
LTLVLLCDVDSHAFSLQEKAYNPFYTLVVSRLLNESPTQATHSYQITLQYALWDFFRSLGEDEVGGASMAGSGGTTDRPDVVQKKSNHLARAYAWWCAKSSLSLNILKVSARHVLLSAKQANMIFLAPSFPPLTARK